MAVTNVILTNVKMYDEIVSHAYGHYQELTKSYNELRIQSSTLNSDEDAKAYSLEHAMDRVASIILVFSEMTIEAFCNAYLLTQYSKNSFEHMSFIDKVDHTVMTMLNKYGKIIQKADADKYYGCDIKKIISIRKKLVHRYPVSFELNTDSDKQFEHDALAAVTEIEDQYLRRVEKADVDNAAFAYQKFKEKMSSMGVDFDELGFVC